MLATDFDNGRRDLFGPYPRIPDKELLKVTFVQLLQFNFLISHQILLVLINFIIVTLIRLRLRLIDIGENIFILLMS